MPALEVSALVVRYGELTAVDRLSFSGERGEVLALLGPNGAGKTTTVETLEGYRQPSAGRVRVLDRDPVAERRDVAPRIGVMLQRGGVYPTMSAREAIRLFASYYRDPEDVSGLIDRLGLEPVASTPWRRLSGGEQQRVSLALALVGKPDVAFLDEPTAGIDPAAKRMVRDVIAELRARGACVVLTTHDLDEVEEVADRIVLIDNGRLVASGTPAELMASGGGEEIRFGAQPGIDIASLAERVGAPVTEDRPGEYLVAAAATPQRVAAITAWLADRDLALADLRAGRQTLEDVFLQLTGGDSAAAADHQPVARPARGRRRRTAP